ncbi:MAG TPA: inositol monophosphatase [Actinobacteria bacterium]|nr:inositol monophosphatase [Actinomycetota bacterium]
MSGPNDDLLRDLLARARGAAAKAAVLLANPPADLGVQTKATPTDVVTVMDKRSEALLLTLLLDGRENDGVLGEEGADRAGTSGFRWVIDPIDGTVNYMYGLPGWSVCVGLEYEGEPIVGVVTAPTYGVTYYAARGLGAFREVCGVSEAIRPSQVAELSMALTATGFGYASTQRSFQAEILRSLLPEIRDIRRAGSAAVDICWVADGKIDAAYEKGLNRWDYLAASVVATEVGVVVAGLDGRGPSADLTIAANPILFAKLHDRLKQLGADQPV